MKVCSQCQRELPLTAFDIQSTGKLGRRADCKECRKRFVRSQRGLIKEIYHFQVSKSKKRGYTLPTYTEIELWEWAQNNPEFHLLYQDWIASGYQSNFKPSIDRINDHISYRIDNIQVITWSENNTKGKLDQVPGNNNKRNLAVDMLDQDGKFIERFHSVSAAARRFNGVPSNIIGAINQRITRKKEPDGSYRQIKVTTAYGHRWRYSDTPNDISEIKPCKPSQVGNTC